MFSIDHFVIAAKDPAQAADAFARKHDIQTIEGGRHTKWGTYNYLAYFSNDCYIEWLGIFDQSLAVQSDNPLVQQLVTAFEADVEGTIQFALRTDEMDAYLDHFDALDIAYTGPIPGNRQKPDGTMLQWRMLFPELVAETAPFLIEWGVEKNTPPEGYLNKQQVTSVSCGLSVNDMKQIYQLDIADNSVQLGNGLLVLEEGVHIGFELA